MTSGYLGLRKHLSRTADIDADDLGEMKKVLKSRGVNQRGWRLFLDFGEALFNPVNDHLSKLRTDELKVQESANWLRLLQACEMDLAPPQGLAEATGYWLKRGTTFADFPALLFRALWKQVVKLEYAEEDLRSFLDEKALFAANWCLYHGGKDILTEGQLKSGWDAIWECCKQDIVSKKHREWMSWSNWIHVAEYDGYTFEALESAVDLLQEGQRMNHCIATYAYQCKLGLVRVYHIRNKREGTPVATMTVSLDAEDQWVSTEVHGPDNDEVSERVYIATDAVSRSLNDIARMSPRIKHAMQQSQIIR